MHMLICSGYAGHVPLKQRFHGMTHTEASQRALVRFAACQATQQALEAERAACQAAVCGPFVPPPPPQTDKCCHRRAYKRLDVYPVCTGLTPHYTGHAPGT